MSVDLQAIIALIGVFGLLLLVLAADRIRKARLLAAAGSTLAAVALLGAAALLLRISLNVGTYTRLIPDEPVAELVFDSEGPQRYRVAITRIPAGDMQVLELSGDEWRLDARLLFWRRWARLAGLDAQYRLERLVGGYRTLEDERSKPRSVYRLSENPGLDLWVLAFDRPSWSPFVDAAFATAADLPMADGARFRISVSATGLIARPMNTAARAALAEPPRPQPGR